MTEYRRGEGQTEFFAPPVNSMKTIFFGTPSFAVPTLRALVEVDLTPLRVVSQPARPVGRKRQPQDPPVAEWARRHGLDVRQPESVRDSGFLADLTELEPDVAVVVAFGQISRRRLLELPRHGCINLHASLLPNYRGAAPIQAAIAAGEPRTGVTTMRMEAGLDSGSILLQAELEFGREETSPELSERLAELGAGLMVETLARLAAGTLAESPQQHELATYAPRLTKADGVCDWRLTARRIFDLLRAYTPWPGLTATLRGKALKILWARPLQATSETAQKAALPGTIVGLRQGLLAVVCGDGTLLGLERVQRPGKKPLPAVELWNGERLTPGERFMPSSAEPSEHE